MFTFNRTLPEEAGVPSKAILDVITYLDKKMIPMHSILIMRGDKLIFEKYYAPYKADTLHRMFSISKSFTGVAIALLTQEGKLSIDDHIVDYFPEYVDNQTHHWINETTIRNMLEMRSCHASSTFSDRSEYNWVESFFTVPPTHKPGTVFHYDTSATHVLSALVEKLSGTDLLSYLKDKALKYVDFSSDSYMIKDSRGVAMGGSGLMATPLDIMKFLYILKNNGTITDERGELRSLFPKEYVKNATSNISDTLINAPSPCEAQGYGMQIWQNEKGGFVLYGLGGQFGISIPEQDLLIVTTADTLGIQGGNQIIYDAFYNLLLPHIDSLVDATGGEYAELIETANRLEISLPRTPENYLRKHIKISSAAFEKYADGYFNLEDNLQKYTTLRLNLAKEGMSYLELKRECNNKTEDLQIDFGFTKMQTGLFPIYNNEYTAGAIWLRDNSLYIRVHMIGEIVGSVHFQFYFGDYDVVVHMRKIEGTYLDEFEGHLYGHLITQNKCVSGDVSN